MALNHVREEQKEVRRRDRGETGVAPRMSKTEYGNKNCCFI